MRGCPSWAYCVAVTWYSCCILKFSRVAGWRHNEGGHVFFHTVEKASDATVHFGVCNSGDGLNYHPVNMESYPKVRGVFVAVFVQLQ